MGYDLKLHDEARAKAEGIDGPYFSGVFVTISGMSRLRYALTPVLTMDLTRRLTLNDGAIVTPVECIAMAQRLDDALVAKSPAVRDGPEFFREFSDFCRKAAKYEGFEVW